MTPGNTREITLNLGRERLARALSKIDRLSRDAIETITQLRLDKAELDARINDLHKRFEQERTNFEQRAILLQSVNSESEERARAFEELERAKSDQEIVIQEQLSVIATLKSELSGIGLSQNEQLEHERELRGEMEKLQAANASIEERLTAVTFERDTMKSQLYAREREDAQWALRLTAEEKIKATKAIDALIDQLASIESKVANGQNLVAESK